MLVTVPPSTRRGIRQKFFVNYKSVKPVQPCSQKDSDTFPLQLELQEQKKEIEDFEVCII